MYSPRYPWKNIDIAAVNKCEENILKVDDDEDTKQLPLVKDETRGGRRHPQKQGSAIDLDIGEGFMIPCTDSNTLVVINK